MSIESSYFAFMTFIERCKLIKEKNAIILLIFFLPDD